MMNRLITISLLLLLASCANNSTVLDSAYDNKIEYFGGITFLSGPWHSPGTEYGYHINDRYLYIAHESVDGHDKHIIEIARCSNLRVGIEELKQSIYTTAEIFVGIRTPPESDIIVMDGPTYSLEYYSSKIGGTITLEGGYDSYEKTPWIKAAINIGDLAKECEEVNKSSNSDGVNATDLPPL